MKKIISIFALLLSASLSLSLFASAAKTTAASGFYNIGSKENIVITPYAAKDVAATANKDVNNDGKDDVWYQNSDRLEVSYTVDSNDGYYGVMLVEGSSLPAEDVDIFYIDQVTPKENTVHFSVKPTLPTESTDLTLYISSSVAGAELLAIPLSYTADAGSSSVPGDLNGDETVGAKDITYLRRALAGGYGISLAASAGDLSGDGAFNAKDVTILRRAIAGGYGVTLK